LRFPFIATGKLTVFRRYSLDEIADERSRVRQGKVSIGSRNTVDVQQGVGWLLNIKLMRQWMMCRQTITVPAFGVGPIR